MQRYLTAQQVCERLGGVSEMTLWRYQRDPRLAFPAPVVIRRRRYFAEAEVEAWMTAHRAPAAPSAQAA